jgi:hypothetical protein
MRIEQEQSDLGSIEARCLRNGREGRRLIGRCSTLRRRNNMASLTPSVSKPPTIDGVGAKCRSGRNYRRE